jgi:hypothetical protein
MTFIAVLLLLLLGAGPAPGRAYPAAEGFRAAESDARAMEIADEVMEAMGGYEAWNATRILSWRFFGRRHHVWDRTTNDVRIEADDTVVLLNLDSREGRVFVEGDEVTDPERKAELLEKGYAWWVNDSYWVFMPYKLKDSGVRLKYLGEKSMTDGRPAEVLELTFDQVGLTPQNKYDVYVDASTHLVGEWSYYENAGDAQPQFTMPWSDWRKVGRILLAGDHGRGNDWDLRTYDSLPRSVFEDPAPPDLQ